MTRCAVLKMKRLGVVLVVSLALLVVPGASQADLYLPLVQKTAMYDIDSNLDVRADDQFVHTSGVVRNRGDRLLRFVTLRADFYRQDESVVQTVTISLATLVFPGDQVVFNTSVGVPTEPWDFVIVGLGWGLPGPPSD